MTVDMFAALRRTRLSDGAVEHIRDLIETGRLTPGQRLPGERELSERLNVSRASVREALRALEAMGLIEVRPGTGAFVKDPSSDVLRAPLKPWLASHRDAIMELFEVRELVEPGAAALAAARRTPALLAELADTLEAMEKAITTDDLVAACLADADFHHTIIEATGNRFLLELLDGVARQLEEGRKASLRIPGQPARALAGHRAIAAAIARGDPIAARDSMEVHLRDARFFIEQWLQGQADDHKASVWPAGDQ
jgi:GntR family transcriptional repressor for pyruvate dehydrogenase complex